MRQHLVERYCLDCHNTADWAGGLALDTADLSNVAADAKLWESVVRKVRAGMMPPGGKPRPPRQDMQAFAGGIERELDRAAATRPVLAASGVRRLNRVQYGNAIRDLLDLDVDVTTSLPPDDVSHGFDNGETLGSSPALIEGYVVRRNARQPSRRGRHDCPALTGRVPCTRGAEPEETCRGTAAGHPRGFRRATRFPARRAVRDPRRRRADAFRRHGRPT